jgi:hypothetical protein
LCVGKRACILEYTRLMSGIMLPTYSAVLRDGVLHWGTDGPPALPADVAIPVHITLLEPLKPMSSNGDPSGLGRDALSAIDRMIDLEFLAECANDASPEVTLAEVRAGLSTIPGNLTADFAAERDER